MEKIIGLIMILSSMRVMLSKSEVYSVLHLINVLCCVGIVLVINNLEYIGIMVIMIYVGAIGVLFLFVVMMIEVEEEEELGFTNRLSMILSIMYISYCLSNESTNVIGEEYLEIINVLDNLNGISMIGESLYVSYVYDVLVVGVILLICIIGGYMLVRNRRLSRKV